MINTQETVSDYRISPSAAAAGELVRVAFAEVDLAIALAREIPLDPAPSVHECRKAIKRIRALAQLCKEGKTEEYQAIDRKLRDAGRLLAESRDAHVVQRTATKLASESGHLDSLEFAPALPVPDRAAIVTCVDLLVEARDGLEGICSRSDRSVESLLQAVGHSRNRAAVCMDRFRARGRATDAHAWRKAVQRYANKIRLMAGFLPADDADRLAALDDLAAGLGEYQDLTVLRQTLKTGRVRCAKTARKWLLESAKSHRRRLRKELLASGALLFAGAGSAQTVKAEEFVPAEQPS